MMEEGGAQLNAVMNTSYMQIKFKEIGMTVWPQEHEDDEPEKKIHTISDRNIKVWMYFVCTLAVCGAVTILITLFTRL